MCLNSLVVIAGNKGMYYRIQFRVEGLGFRVLGGDS